MLRSLAEPDPPMGGRIFPGQVGVPYFTLLVDGRGVLEDADQGQFDISDEELLDLAAQVLTAEEDFGYLGSYQLRYYRVSIPGGWRLVFADDSLQGELRLRQVRNSLLLGLALLPVFLAFSWLLAGLIVRPVRRAWEQQAQFVADASHELKTPLTVILSNTEMILADCPQEDPGAPAPGGIHPPGGGQDAGTGAGYAGAGPFRRPGPLPAGAGGGGFQRRGGYGGLWPSRPWPTRQGWR